MPVKIRLQRKGRKKKPFYFIVVADSRAPRDGKFIQKIGTYNPLTVPATIQLDRHRALHWLQKGAQPTDTVRRILSFKGVLYLKHLMRGVKLGLFDEQKAMEKFEQWTSEHEDKVLKKREKHQAAKEITQEEPTPVAKEVEEEAEQKEPAKEEASSEAEVPAEPEAEAPVEMEEAKKEAVPSTAEADKKEKAAEKE